MDKFYKTNPPHKYEEGLLLGRYLSNRFAFDLNICLTGDGDQIHSKDPIQTPMADDERHISPHRHPIREQQCYSLRQLFLQLATLRRRGFQDLEGF